MPERYLQLRMKLALKPFRDTQGNVDGLDVTLWYDGMPMEEDQKLIEFDFDIPVSLWDPPLIKGRIKSQIQEIFTEFIEGMEITNAS